MSKHYYFFLPSGSVLGGVESWVCNVVTELNKTVPGIASIISFDIGKNEIAFPEHLISAVQEIPFDLEPENCEESIKSVVKILSQTLKPNAVLIPNYSVHAYSVAVGLKKDNFQGCQIWSVLHSDEEHYYRVAEYFQNFIDLYICVSSEIKEVLRKILPDRESNIVVKACGVLISRIDPEKIISLKKKNDILRICYIGRVISYQKRVFDMISFLRYLDSENIQYVVDIVGHGQELEMLRKKLEKPISEMKVILHGRQPHDVVKKVLSSSDIYISFSEFEGTSLALVEAMNFGCIPVVTNVSGVSDLLQESRSKFIYKVGDIRTAVSYIKKIRELKFSEKNELIQTYINRAWTYDISSYSIWFRELDVLKGDGSIVASNVFLGWREWRETRKFIKVISIIGWFYRALKNSSVYSLYTKTRN